MVHLSFSQSLSESFMRDLGIIQQMLPESHYDDRLDKITGEPIQTDMVVLHCSSGTPDRIFNVLEERGLSVHYIVGSDGRIIQCVDENKRAWHAGPGEWDGVNNVNAHSIGIEIENPTYGHSSIYPEIQIQTVQKLCASIMERHDIKPYNVFGHGDMAPTRKADPGRLFPWQELANSGIGVWPTEEGHLQQNDTIERLLQNIGYPTKAFNIKPEDTLDIVEKKGRIALNAALYAFKRHYMPETIADEEMSGKDQLEFLRKMEQELPQFLMTQSKPDTKTMQCLKSTALAYSISRARG